MSKKAHKVIRTLLEGMQPGDTAVVALAASVSMSKSKVHDETTPDPTSDNDDDKSHRDNKRRSVNADASEPLYIRIVRKGNDGDDILPMALLFSVAGNIATTAPRKPDKQPDPVTGEYPTDDHGMQTFDPVPPDATDAVTAQTAPCPGHESTIGPAGIARYCDGSCQRRPK